CRSCGGTAPAGEHMSLDGSSFRPSAENNVTGRPMLGAFVRVHIWRSMMPKLIVPIEPDAYYTVEARYPSGATVGTSRHVLGRDVAKEKRSLRSVGEEGYRLVYEVTLEGESPRELPMYAQPKAGIWPLDSNKEAHLYKKPLPSLQQEYETSLRVRI